MKINWIELNNETRDYISENYCKNKSEVKFYFICLFNCSRSCFRFKWSPHPPQLSEVEDQSRVRRVAEQRCRLVDVCLRSCQQIETNRGTPEIGRIHEQTRPDSEKKDYYCLLIFDFACKQIKHAFALFLNIVDLFVRL